LLNEDELKEHQENVRGVEQYLAKYKEMLQGKGGKRYQKFPLLQVPHPQAPQKNPLLRQRKQLL